MAASNSSEKTERDIYYKLLDLIPNLRLTEEAARSKQDGYMDLGLDILYRSPERIVIALSHYYRHPSGDLIPDPDMTVEVLLKHDRAMAVSYQDSFGYQSVTDFDGVADKGRQRVLNRFLSQWLTNLIVQGHHIGCEENGHRDVMMGEGR